MDNPWYFDNPLNVASLAAAAQAWRGTPFAPFSRAQGPHGGIDCIGFVEELMAAAGLERFNFQRTEDDYSRHVHNDKILNYLRGLVEKDVASAMLSARFAELHIDNNSFLDAPMPGDILVLKDGSNRTGLGVFHMPVMLGRRKFVHCAPRLGVCEGNIDDATYRNNLVAHFRARAVLDSSLITHHSSLP